jgi:hypothetical protein
LNLDVCVGYPYFLSLGLKFFSSNVSSLKIYLSLLCYDYTS